PPGADTTMTTHGPDQVWYVVVAVTCIAIPALFLTMRIYTRLAIVRSLEMADCNNGMLAWLMSIQPLIAIEVVMGYWMVHWGAGVHQWQVTLDQLFHQLYVSTLSVSY
ncbi:hypothetical protein EK21DRAFT_41916, partial [Setomelanomma holmii]